METLKTSVPVDGNSPSVSNTDSPTSRDDDLIQKLDRKTASLLQACKIKDQEQDSLRTEIGNLKRRVVNLADSDRNKGEVIAVQAAELDRFNKEFNQPQIAFLLSTREHMVKSVYEARQGIMHALKALTVHSANIRYYRDERPDIYSTLVPNVNDAIQTLASSDTKCRELIQLDLTEEEKIQVGATVLTSDGHAYSTITATAAPHLPLIAQSSPSPSVQRGASIDQRSSSASAQKRLALQPPSQSTSQSQVQGREYSPAPESNRTPPPAPMPQKDATPAPNLSAQQYAPPPIARSGDATPTPQRQQQPIDLKNMSPDQRAKLIQQLQKRVKQ
jgi:hypothetical protein